MKKKILTFSGPFGVWGFDSDALMQCLVWDSHNEKEAKERYDRILKDLNEYDWCGMSGAVREEVNALFDYYQPLG